MMPEATFEQYTLRLEHTGVRYNTVVNLDPPLTVGVTIDESEPWCKEEILNSLLKEMYRQLHKKGEL